VNELAIIICSTTSFGILLDESAEHHTFPEDMPREQVWAKAVNEAAKHEPEVIEWMGFYDLDQLFKEHLRGGK
jgi:hypothetical protein